MACRDERLLCNAYVYYSFNRIISKWSRSVYRVECKSMWSDYKIRWENATYYKRLFRPTSEYIRN